MNKECSGFMNLKIKGEYHILMSLKPPKDNKPAKFAAGYFIDSDIQRENISRELDLKSEYQEYILQQVADCLRKSVMAKYFMFANAEIDRRFYEEEGGTEKCYWVILTDENRPRDTHAKQWLLPTHDKYDNGENNAGACYRVFSKVM